MDRVAWGLTLKCISLLLLPYIFLYPFLFSTTKESMENSKIPKVIAMITSSQKAQKSHELSYRSYSVFTDLFCNPIQTSLDENGTNYGHIYIKQIFEYINKNLQTDKQYSNFKFKQPSDFYIDKVEAEEKI